MSSAAQRTQVVNTDKIEFPNSRQLAKKTMARDMVRFWVEEVIPQISKCTANGTPGAWRSKQKQLRLKYKKLYDFVQNATDEPIDAAKRIDAVWNSLGFVSGKFTDLETLTSKENAATLADEDQLKVSFHNIRNQRCSKEKMNRKRKKEVLG